MCNLFSNRWEYLRNSEGTFSIFPAGDPHAPVIAKVMIEGVADPEVIARSIAAVPELIMAVKQGIEIMRAIRSYMSFHGLTIEGINEIIGTHDELIYRLDVGA